MTAELDEVSHELAPGVPFAGRYVVQRLLGSGGMGTVYEVIDRLVGESVALKLANSGFEKALDAIRHEVLMARRVTHPNVARIFDLGMDDRTLYMTMELIQGAPLSKTLANGPLPLRSCVRIAAQLSCALGAAHDAGVLHLDIKPRNVMVVPGTPDRVVLLDFGIARALGTRGEGFGTIAFASPEQMLDEPLNGASDVYSLGLLLYVMTTGEHPFSVDSSYARVARTAPSLHSPESPEFGRLVDSMLATAPADRPSIAMVASELAKLSLDGDTASCAISLPPPRARHDLVTLPHQGGGNAWCACGSGSSWRVDRSMSWGSATRSSRAHPISTWPLRCARSRLPAIGPPSSIPWKPARGRIARPPAWPKRWPALPISRTRTVPMLTWHWPPDRWPMECVRCGVRSQGIQRMVLPTTSWACWS